MAKTTLKTSLWTGAAVIAVGASLLTLPSSAPAGIGASLGMRCYPAKRAKGVVVPEQVALVQDNLQATNSTIGKPFMVCLPAEILGGTPINATIIGIPQVQVCYKAKDMKGTPKLPKQSFNATLPLIGTDSLELGTSKVVCLPESAI